MHHCIHNFPLLQSSPFKSLDPDHTHTSSYCTLLSWVDPSSSLIKILLAFYRTIESFPNAINHSAQPLALISPPVDCGRPPLLSGTIPSVPHLPSTSASPSPHIRNLLPTMAKTPVPSSTPMFSTSIFSSNAASRPTTRDGSDPSSTVSHTLAKDRKASFSRKSSLSGSRRRGSSFGNGPNAYVTDAAAPPALPEYALAAAAKVVPRADVGKQPSDHPVQTPGSAGEGFGMLTRTNTGSTTYFGAMPAGAAYVGVPGSGMGVGAGLMLQQQESILIHQQITDLANKRIATLDYLRKT